MKSTEETIEEIMEASIEITSSVSEDAKNLIRKLIYKGQEMLGQSMVPNEELHYCEQKKESPEGDIEAGEGEDE